MDACHGSAGRLRGRVYFGSSLNGIAADTGGVDGRPYDAVHSDRRTARLDCSRHRGTAIRPVTLPPMADGTVCPVTLDTSAPSSDLAAMYGNGTVRPILGPHGEIVIAPPVNFGSETWGGNKVLWALSVEAGGPALIRGGRLDGPEEVRFDDGSLPSEEKVLDPKGGTALGGGWYDFPGFVRLSTPGCYGFQIDTTAGSDYVVAEATV